jgi:hypothetical protein
MKRTLQKTSLIVVYWASCRPHLQDPLSRPRGRTLNGEIY